MNLRLATRPHSPRLPRRLGVVYHNLYGRKVGLSAAREAELSVRIAAGLDEHEARMRDWMRQNPNAQFTGPHWDSLRDEIERDAKLQALRGMLGRVERSAA